MDLTVKRVGPGEYLVEGGAEPHWVDASVPSCDCDDREGERYGCCKHLLAVGLFRAGLLGALQRAIGR